jgi:hypothetical protein
LAANTSDGRRAHSSSSCSCYVRFCFLRSIRSSSAAYLHEMMLHCALCIHPVIVQFSARHTRACFISSTLHVYMCHSSSGGRRADRWCSPTRMQSRYMSSPPEERNFACTITLSALLSSHAASRGGERFAFAGLAHVLHPSPTCPAARAGLVALIGLEEALLFAVPLCWAICSLSITLPASAADCVFPLASGNVFWRRHNRPGKLSSSPVVRLG